MLKQFAEELKAQKLLLEISIEDIYEKTRIDKKYLEAMENGDFEIMPQVYMRAFIRKYAEAVNLDPNEAILKYDAARSGKLFETVSSDDMNDNSDDDVDNEKQGRQSPNNVSETKVNPIIILGFVILIVLSVASYFVFFDSDNEEIIVEKPIEEILSERGDSTETLRFEINQEELDAQAKMENMFSNQDSLVLKINAVDTVWIQIMTDQGKQVEYILHPKRSKTIKAKSKFDILIGNTGGVEFLLNDKKIDFVGKKGEIKSVIIDSRGLRFPQNKEIITNE